MRKHRWLRDAKNVVPRPLIPCFSSWDCQEERHWLPVRVSEGNSTPGRIQMGPNHSFPPGLHFHQQGRKCNTPLQAFDTDVWGSQSDLYYTHVNQGLLVPQTRWHFTAAVLIRPQISPSLTCILKGDGRCLDHNSMPFPLHVWLGQLLKERKKKFWGQRGGLCWCSSWSRSSRY